MFLFLFAVGYTEISYAKRVIIFTGLTMLLVNFSSSWILVSKYMQNNLLRFRIPISQEVLKNPAPIYSEGFDIEDVWKLGREIKLLNKNIPDEKLIFFLGDKEPKDLLKNYEIKKIYNYQKVTHDIEKLYLLENYDKSEEKVIKFTKKELINAIKSEDSEEEILNIIQKLILESKYLGSILEGENLRDKGFIPYDEINKRPYRLQVKPLIKLNNIYYFSREICKRTINVFLRHILNGKLPYRSKYKEIQDVMDKYAKKIQNNIVDRAFEILKENGYKIIYKEVDLRKLDKNGNHPLLEKLGDYDILVFDVKNNIVLNIECKYISQDFCAKDLKNTMEKLFGKNENDKSYIG